MKQHFSFSYLILLPRDNLFRFISCRCGHLWHCTSSSSSLEPILSDNPTLGADPNAHFVEIEHPWNVGDSILLYASSLSTQSSSKETLFSQEQLQASLGELLRSSAQRQVDSILRKAKVNLSRTSDERSAVFISLIRKE